MPPIADKIKIPCYEELSVRERTIVDAYVQRSVMTTLNQIMHKMSKHITQSTRDRLTIWRNHVMLELRKYDFKDRRLY